MEVPPENVFMKHTDTRSNATVRKLIGLPGHIDAIPNTRVYTMRNSEVIAMSNMCLN
jgi:hypothetical protein